MRIERIRSSNLPGVGDFDRTFPEGPVLLYFEEKGQQQAFGNLLLDLFYDIKTASADKARNSLNSVELWLAAGNSRWHICRQFGRQDEEGERSADLMIEDESGQTVALPEKMMLGEYFFQAGVRAFQQGGVVEWPEGAAREDLSPFVYNMRQGGDERLSTAKVRASLSGAQKRVEEQREGMLQLQAEYAALRREWEAAHRRQEEERLKQIDLKNLQEKVNELTERIAAGEKMQKRLALLAQNPDYRELRRLQGEIARLEEQRQAFESSLAAVTSEQQVDWTLIESLRAECLEWALCQAEEGRLIGENQLRAGQIQEAANFLQFSDYVRTPDSEAERLRLVEEERSEAESELEKLGDVQREIDKVQGILVEETAGLADFADLAGVTGREEIKVAQREKHLAQWKNSRLAGLADQILLEQFGEKSIRERLTDRLVRYYQKHGVGNYETFRHRLQEFHEQQQKVESLRSGWEGLEERAKRKEELQQIVHSRGEILKQACSMAKAPDLAAWFKGWESYRQTKDQLAAWVGEQQLALKQQQLAAANLAECAEQLREKLENWGILSPDREEALAGLMQVAVKLRAKEEAERESREAAERFQTLLGERKMEYLAEALEPLADLERETHLTDEERLMELAAWRQELMEARGQLATAGQILQHRPNGPSLAVLEKKMEAAKRRWLAVEDLRRALADAQALWEACWQAWQKDYGQALEEEARRISAGVSSGNYFAQRMAIARLALGENTEVPLLFSVREMKEGQGFWEEVSAYLQQIALTRQVIFSTCDARLQQVLAGRAGWQKSGGML